jgi:hypothetical protein
MISPRSLAMPLLLLGVGFFLLPGCSGEKFGSVSGNVRFKGKLMNGGQVVLANEDNTRVERVPIEPDGSYSTSRAPYGNLRVGVDPPPQKLIMPKNAKPPKDAPGGNAGAEAYARKSVGDYVEIPADKRNPMTSNIFLKIDSSKTTFDIDVH